ncbi:hypothetical protein D0Z07_2364 [Hyphodiscus hymeniophilus]|uniref:Uncharacterized protein n=1 Tax=Hyphodiscus hymeniophilus TaxID=353542 RepID=A0A9P6VMK9_9HELO|nr:hypothetical protein D0Z07_2364 [Hyphodiscus hymeniophilus]
MSKFRGAGIWKSDAPVRTNTGGSIRGRISAPIIVDDDEFPIREPGTGIATPLPKDSMERPFSLKSATGSVHDFQPECATSNGTGDSSRASLPPQPAYDPPPPPMDQPSALRNTMASSPSSLSNGKPHRKKSSLSAVFRRLFGAKKRKDSSSFNTTIQGPGGSKAGQHRSDPSALTRNPKDLSPPQKRSASLPINEFNIALRSHSNALEDFPLEEGTNRESIQADGQIRPRRATTPSRLWAPNKSRGYGDWTGLSPRPASTHGRDSKLISDVDANAAVGIAVTSGSHPNRRSRSLGELRDFGTANITIRRRSDEIKYWRESYDPGLLSPMSSNKADAEEPIQLDLPQMPQEVPQEQPQPFNFGPMGEMAGMKITQAASLETRVQRVEDRMVQMEKAIYQLYHRTAREAVIFQEPPKKNLRRERSASTKRPRTDESEIILPTQPRYRELHPPAGNPLEARSGLHLMVAVRPLSTSTTIRGVPSSSPTMSKDAHLTGEHYTVLTNMILAEQAARQDLEATVQSLQQQLQVLGSGGAASCQTPGSNMLARPLKAGDGNQFSSFEQDDSSDDEGRYVQDVFQTPMEERGMFSDEIFGGVNGTDAKSPRRTLSLSRMTRGVQPSVNF